MSDCNSPQCELDAIDGSEVQMYWRLASNFSAICSLFSVAVVLYFLIIREHPSKPDDTDENEKKKFFSNRVHGGNNLLSEFFNGEFRLLMHKLFEPICVRFRVILTTDFDMEDMKCNPVTGELQAKEIKSNEAVIDIKPKAKLFKEKKDHQSKKRKEKNTNRDHKILKRKVKKLKSAPPDVFSDGNREMLLKSECRGSYELISIESDENPDVESEVETEDDESLSSEIANLDFESKNNSNQHVKILMDTYGVVRYIREVNVIYVLIKSLQNESEAFIYRANVYVDVYYKNSFKNRYLSKKILDEVKPMSVKDYAAKYIIKLNDKMLINFVDVYIVIIGKILAGDASSQEAKPKFKILGRIRVSGFKIPVFNSDEDL